MTQNTQRCRWCKELYRGKCGCDDDAMMEKMAEALNDLTFECFEFFNTIAPSIETYNKAFKVLQEYKEKSNE